MTGSTVLGVMTVTCSAVAEVAVARLRVAVDVEELQHALWILPVISAPNMVILQISVGGATLTVMRMRVVLVVRKAHMEWIQTGIWTQAQLIT
jgi:hypothetical protein